MLLNNMARLQLCFCLIAIFFVSFAKHCQSAAAGGGGQAENADHGAHSPHDKRTKEKEHYSKDGGHNQEYDHESVLGSRKMAEEFDQLSPEESKKRLGLLAKLMDKNEDGVVDEAELTDWIEKSLKKLDEEEVDERFGEIDDDSDDQLSWDEYKRDAFGELDDGPMDTEDVQLMEEDKRYFSAADIDKDGKLSKDEFAAFQNPEGFEHMYPSLLKATLDAKDKDRDGKLSEEEFVGSYNDGDQEWVEQEKQRFHEEYDADKDGFLNDAEMQKWLIPNLRETAREEAEHLMGQADKDADKKLSYAEIVDEHDAFVGSEATNYGEHLENIHEEL